MKSGKLVQTPHNIKIALLFDTLHFQNFVASLVSNSLIRPTGTEENDKFRLWNTRQAKNV